MREGEKTRFVCSIQRYAKTGKGFVAREGSEGERQCGRFGRGRGAVP